jgi:hypothetical protein
MIFKITYEKFGSFFKFGVLRLVIIAIITFSNVSFGQDFVLKKIDKTALEQKFDYRQQIYKGLAYAYLVENYATRSARYDIFTIQNERLDTCGFKQEFEFNIHYYLENCEKVEGAGMDEKITFPKISTAAAQNFIMTLFQAPENTWVSEFDYEPDGAGCYYSILQEKNRTIIACWCGC